jgi:hypothetical protein
MFKPLSGGEEPAKFLWNQVTTQIDSEIPVVHSEGDAIPSVPTIDYNTDIIAETPVVIDADDLSSLSIPSVPTVSPGTSVKGYTEISDVAISIASPCVVTSAGHGIVDDEIIKFTTTGALPTGLTAFTYYYCNYIDVDTFNVSTEPDGANINTSGSQSGTQSVWHET